VAVVALDGVSVHRAGRQVLDGVTLQIEGPGVVAVIGPNGAGKSTLFAVLAGRLRPSRGTATVAGTVADVLQATAVDPEVGLPVEDVVRMGRYPLRGLRRLRRRDHDAVQAALEAMDLVGLERRTIDALSGGQRQRVLVAQGLAQEADVLLLDEPTAGLDAPSRRRVLEVVRREAAGGRTVLLATHDADEVHAADVALVLAGRVVAFGPPDDVLEDPAVVALFGRRSLRTDVPSVSSSPLAG
jgi:ABC-type Mn2+/Zn2+ transport system ATPase subunit